MTLEAVPVGVLDESLVEWSRFLRAIGVHEDGGENAGRPVAGPVVECLRFREGLAAEPNRRLRVAEVKGVEGEFGDR